MRLARRLARLSENDMGEELTVQSVSTENVVEQSKSSVVSPDPVQTFAPVPVEREALEAAVKNATAPHQLEYLLMQYPPTQLSMPELVLFCNQLGKVTNANTSTVRDWSQTQVHPHTMHACMTRTRPPPYACNGVDQRHLFSTHTH